MNLECLLIVTLALAQAGAATFETDMSPGEGPHVFVAARNQLRIHKLPFSTSPTIATVKVLPGQSLPHDETRYRTIRGGVIRVLVPSQVEGRMIGMAHLLFAKDYTSDKFPEIKIQVKRDMHIEYLQYRAEGTCFVRISNNVIDATPCPNINRSAFKVEAEPKTELWIHLSIGKASGWVFVDDVSVTEQPQ